MPHPAGGYKVKGKRVPGVTTIIGRFKDSGGLLWWAFEQGKAAERGEISNLYDKRDEAGDLGTLVHSMVENHIRGTSPPSLDHLAQEQRTAVESGFGAFELWTRQSKLKVVHQELEMVSEKNSFGGCPDAIGEVNGELCLLDWKTASGIYPDNLVQLAAYRLLWEENYPDQPLTGGYHLCRFSKEFGDFSHHHYPELEGAERQFLLFREAYEIDKVLKRRAK
jgi:hypothetical protein